MGVANDVLTSGAGVLLGQASATTVNAVNTGPDGDGAVVTVGASVPSGAEPTPGEPEVVEVLPAEPSGTTVVNDVLVVEDVDDVDFGLLVGRAVIAFPLPEHPLTTKATAPRSMIPRLLSI